MFLSSCSYCSYVTVPRSSEREKERKKERRIDETQINLIKTKHPAKRKKEDKERGPKIKDPAKSTQTHSKGGKEGQRERTHDLVDRAKSAQTQRGVTRGQRNKLCFRVATSCKKYIRERKERVLKALNLKV